MDLPLRPITRRIAVIGNHLPRRCGIATFTTDLTDALAHADPASSYRVLAMDDVAEGYDYPPRVTATLAQHDLVGYRRAADVLNARNVDLVLVQHEYGIFGGSEGEHLLTLLRNLRAPVVTTLHTVLRAPNAEQRRVLCEVARLSSRVVVMSRRGAELLRTVYGVPPEKIALIHHGIPDVPHADTTEYKARLGLADRQVLLTFGLLSPGKGIETVIRALPPVVARHPDCLYVVLGATHPHIKAQQGEVYRHSLQALASELGVADHVAFHDRFIDLPELVEYIGAADIYITPYLGREQITSGALAYTVGAGKAVISTPYPYATELLAHGRGLLIPFGDSAAITAQVGHLLEEPDARRVLSEHAYRFGRQMIWPTVARRYLDCFAAVIAERQALVPARHHTLPGRAALVAGEATLATSEAALS
jgi:glycosyltransferase involved in cell wall biosynthesis